MHDCSGRIPEETSGIPVYKTAEEDISKTIQILPFDKKVALCQGGYLKCICLLSLFPLIVNCLHFHVLVDNNLEAGVLSNLVLSNLCLSNSGYSFVGWNVWSVKKLNT